MTTILNNNYNFFYYCTIRLNKLIKYINFKKKIPDYDNSTQFELYNIDNITYEYFNHYNDFDNIIYELDININYNWNYDFNKYEYNKIIPIINKYFSPSLKINIIIKDIEKKYNLKYNNICVLYYNTIKYNTICQYNYYINYSKLIIKENPNIIFLIQSNKIEFIKFMKNMYPNNSFYFNDENQYIYNIKQYENKLCFKYILALTIIISDCKYIICNSENYSRWIIFYRCNNKNVYNYINNNWIIPSII